jgi:hypothetical protein
MIELQLACAFTLGLALVALVLVALEGDWD